MPHLWHTPQFSPAAPNWKPRRHEEAEVILDVNSAWKKCGQGDSVRSKSWESVCLSVCMTDPEETCGHQEGCSTIPTVEICLQRCQIFIIDVAIANGYLVSGLLPIQICINLYKCVPVWVCICVLCKCLCMHVFVCVCWPKHLTCFQDLVG